MFYHGEGHTVLLNFRVKERVVAFLWVKNLICDRTA